LKRLYIFQAFWDGIEWSNDGVPSVKADYVPVTLQEHLTTKIEIDKLIAELDEMYKKSSARIARR